VCLCFLTFYYNVIKLLPLCVQAGRVDSFDSFAASFIGASGDARAEIIQQTEQAGADYAGPNSECVHCVSLRK